MTIQEKYKDPKRRLSLYKEALNRIDEYRFLCDTFKKSDIMLKDVSNEMLLEMLPEFDIFYPEGENFDSVWPFDTYNSHEEFLFPRKIVLDFCILMVKDEIKNLKNMEDKTMKILCIIGSYIGVFNLGVYAVRIFKLHENIDPFRLTLTILFTVFLIGTSFLKK